MPSTVEAGDAGLLLVGLIERGVLHPERIKESSLEELIERHARRDLNDPSERFHTGEGAVPPFGAGLKVERHAAKLRHVRGERALGVARGDAIALA